MPTGTTPAGRISTNFGSYMPEVTGTPWNPPTSPIGDRPRIRRTRKSQPLKTELKPPSSAAHQPLAEHGSYRLPMESSNLPHRRQIQDSPNTEDTCPENRTQNSIFGDPPTHSPNTAVRPPQNRFPNLRLRRPSNYSPKTEVTGTEQREK